MDCTAWDVALPVPGHPGITAPLLPMLRDTAPPDSGTRLWRSDGTDRVIDKRIIIFEDYNIFHGNLVVQRRVDAVHELSCEERESV